MLILEGAPPWRPYGRNFDLAIGLGSIVAYEVEYGPKMTTTAKPSLGYVAVFWLCRVPPPTQMLILEGAPPIDYNTYEDPKNMRQQFCDGD